MTTARIDHTLRQAIIYSFYLLLLATPLIWNQHNSELFELPKMMFVYTMAVLIGTAHLSRMILARSLLFRHHTLTSLLGLFVLSQLVATLFSSHLHTSIYGFYTRFHGGLLSTFAYATLYLVFIHTFTRREVPRLIGVLIASGFVAAVVALPEHFGYAASCFFIGNHSAGTSLLQMFVADCWVQDIVTRVFGTFGQPNWLAAYLITLTPLVWAQGLLVYRRHTPKTKTSSLISSLALYIVIHTIMLMVLIFTKSRSGLLGLALAYLGFNFAILVRYDRSVTPYLAGLATISVLIFGLFGSIYSPSLYQLLTSYQQSPPAPQTPPPSGTVLDRGGTESGEIRQIVWQGALDIIAANPLIGTGVETFAYSYYNYRPVEHNLVSEWDFLYNKAHNEWLNLAATTGLFGLIAYLLFAGYIALPTLKSLRQEITSSEPVYLIALASGLLALQVSNFFGFSTVAVSVLFFVLPGILVVMYQPESSTKLKALTNSSYLLLTLTSLLGLYLFWQVGALMRADLAYAKARQAEASQQLLETIAHYEQAITIRPDMPIYYNDFANFLSKAAYTLSLEGQGEPASQVANHAQLVGLKTLELNPVHLNFYKTQAGVFIRLSALEPELLNSAAQILEAGLALAPTDAKLTYNLGLVYTDLEATPTAQQYLEQTIALKPNYESARMDLGKLYTSLGQYQQAGVQYEYILNYIAPGNSLAKSALTELATKSAELK